MDLAIERLHKKFGDDADSPEDYHALNDQRDADIHALYTVRAMSWRGIEAKTSVLRLQRTLEDWQNALAIAASLADDIVEAGGMTPTRATPLPLPHPDAELLALVDAFLISEKEHDVGIDAVDKMEESFFGTEKKAPRGYKKAQKIAWAICGRNRKMEQKILATPAKTLGGLIAKARALETNLVDGKSVEDGVDCKFAASFVRDLLALSNRRLIA
jgi:hypothetical protein